jgi:DNA-binding transcriptional ArsR family regulator
MKQKRSMKEVISMEQVDWSSLHKILSDTTRRNILQLLKEKDAISYTEIMAVLRVTNTGRLNYHLKPLNGLISKDDQGKYHLTERGQLAVNLLQTFPEKVQAKNVLFIKKRSLKVTAASLLILLGVFLIIYAFFFAFSPFPGVATANYAFPDRTLPQNTSIFLLASSNGSQFTNASQLTIHWGASNPIAIYVLNSTQYDALPLQNNTNMFLFNFTGMPPYYLDKYTLQSDSVYLTPPQGQYWLYAGSTGNTTLDALSITQQQHLTGGSLPLEYLIAGTPVALGIVMIALAFLILTRRVWR